MNSDLRNKKIDGQYRIQQYWESEMGRFWVCPIYQETTGKNLFLLVLLPEYDAMYPSLFEFLRKKKNIKISSGGPLEIDTHTTHYIVLDDVKKTELGDIEREWLSGMGIHLQPNRLEDPERPREQIPDPKLPKAWIILVVILMLLVFISVLALIVIYAPELGIISTPTLTPTMTPTMTPTPTPTMTPIP